MLSKPKSCEGCPFYQTGKGFVPDELRDGAEVFVYGQNPGCEEEEEGKPFIGKTGQLMEKTFLPVVGRSRESVSLGNAIRCRLGNSNDLPAIDSKITREALTHCHNAHFKLPAATKLIVAQGEYAFYALTQHGTEKYHKISDWRGYLAPLEPISGPRSFDAGIYLPARDNRLPVLASYHLAYLFRDPTANLITRWDWAKIPKILKGTWPQALPTIQDGPPQIWPTRSAFDTEYVPTTKHFLCYSLAYPSATGDGSLVLRVSEVLKPGVLLVDTTSPHVIMQNAIADLPFLEKMMRNFTYDDIMHKHAVLWSDFPHDLGFMGSLYGSVNRWKHLDKINPKLYSAGDAYVTWEINEALDGELNRDGASKRIYQDIQLKLVEIIRRAEAKGVLVHQEEAQKAYDKRQAVMQELTQRAQAIVGWPINLGSPDQIKKQLFEIEGLLKLV